MLEIVLIGVAAGLLTAGILHPPFMSRLKVAAIVVGFLFGIWRLFKAIP